MGREEGRRRHWGRACSRQCPPQALIKGSRRKIQMDEVEEEEEVEDADRDR